jgi:hypothetical protein
MRNIPFAFSLFWALVGPNAQRAIGFPFPPYEAKSTPGPAAPIQGAADPRCHALSTDERPSTPNSASRSRAEGAQKLRKRALNTMKSLARINLCDGDSLLVRPVKSRRRRRIFLFLVNQTFRKPQRMARKR